MNAERLLAHYEQIADAPDAIARLRRFVLDLAVRGKLVLQDASDEPAMELLKRIAVEKARLVKAGEIKSPKSIPALSETPFLIPASWRWSQLAEIGILSPRNDAPDSLKASFVPMPMIAAEYGVANGHEVRPWGDIRKGYTHFAEGDVGLAKITPCFENGKSTVFRHLTGGIGSGTTELHIVRPLFVCPEYILLFLKSPHFVDGGVAKMTGTAGQKRVPSEYFSHSPFPLPPLAEQYRIVAKVDELMVLCDRLEEAREMREATRDRLAAASLDRLNAPDPETFQTDVRLVLDALPALTTRPDQIKQLRQAILNLAVRGKLVRQDPNDEPAAELLKRIAVERSELVRKKVIRREEPLDPIALIEIPFDVPAKWRWSRIGEAVLFTQYGTSQRANPSEKGVPVLTMGNIQDGLVVWSNEKRIPETSDDLPALYLQKFDLLYNRTNSAELVGKTGIYLGEDGVRTFASYLIRLRPSLRSSDPRFLNIAMNAPEFRETQIVPLIKKQTGQANVNGTALKKMLIPLPPLAEQRRIVAKVDELMALCDRLEASLIVTAGVRRRLLDALLAEALTPAEDRELQAAE
ncbi:restriction endonuclease subunit S [Bradyrhizobium sp. IC3195]|uniref:restriction endonuclease subunit S n=1 Tax=Bradyrhizobium sp. IC3195 TaxID=2793804 RepID=UPI001CD71E90|nr:restriction endonuclease subunit S [Bradyrhizobium sp. IC3195]MCA1472887.1 restriction endonuclease subunit S [Bradyrhizobium sp. IC3195]